MPIGGKLLLKGGVGLKGGVKKKHKKAKAIEAAADGASTDPPPTEQAAAEQELLPPGEQHGAVASVLSMVPFFCGVDSSSCMQDIQYLVHNSTRATACQQEGKSAGTGTAGQYACCL